MNSFSDGSIYSLPENQSLNKTNNF